ncbi:MAG: AI-2E family transporter [Lachnospiraceae bacterium]|nr:AI-2E family transporter [Lachnospiraceae bacterium]
MQSLFQLVKPLCIGLIIAFALHRPYDKMVSVYHEKCKINRKLAKVFSILTVYAVVLLGLIVLVMFVVPQIVENVTRFVENIDEYLAMLQTNLDHYMTRFGLNTIDLSELAGLIDSYLGILDQMLPQIVKLTTGVVSFVACLAIAVAFSVYILNGKDHILHQLRRLLRVYLSPKAYGKAAIIYHTIVEVFDNYFVGQSIEAGILGSLCFIGMLILRIDYAAMVSIVVAVTAFVPILGAYVGGALAVVLLMVVSPMKAVTFLIFFVILQQVENNAIYPKVVGRKMGLPGIWVLFGITVGGGLFGIVGMILGVPVLTVIYTLLKRNVQEREKEQNISSAL